MGQNERSWADLQTARHRGDPVDVMVFFGREGWRATSIDPSGANLPLDHGPWTAFHPVPATDPDELADLTRQGFHLVRRKENDDA
jgi:hypothetical protein